MKKKIIFHPIFTFIISLLLVIFYTGTLNIGTTCFAQSAWTQKTNMPTARFGHSSSVLDGKIYVIGGSKSLNGQALKTLEVYDPILDTWTSKADMAEGRTNFSSCIVNGNIYAIGGSQTFYSDPRASIEEYDPITNTWTHKTDMPTVRYCHSSVVMDGKIYVIGGSRVNSGEADATLQVYNPILDTWTSKADMNTPRVIFSACVVNGKIYAIGGSRGPASGFSGMNTVEEYDPATDTWTTKANMITKRKYISACSLNGKIYVFGGEEDLYTLPLSSGEVYDPVTDTWKEITNMPSVLEAPSADKLNGKAYVSGGTLTASPTTPVSTMYEYNPHNDLLLLIEEVNISRSYAKPGVDSVLITTKMIDPTGITILAKIESSDQIPVDSLQLFDDGNHSDGSAGDSVYANTWMVSPAEEAQYYIDIVITRINADTVIQHINNVSTFTTIGPVAYAGYEYFYDDTIFNPGDNQRIKLILKNNSSTVTVTNVEAKLTCADTLVTVTSTYRTVGDIAAGENTISEETYKINIDDEYPPDTKINFNVDIASEGYTFWTDTFSIIVKKPTNIKDIKEPMARIYPNPADDIINIEIENINNAIIEIYSISGRMVYVKEMNTKNVTIDISGYPKGVYIVKVIQDSAVNIAKVIIR